MEIDKIKIHPIEMCSEMACCIAYCIGATSDNVEEIANKIPEDMVFECIDMIRDKVENNKTDISRVNHMHINIFETKSDEELIELYRQFLEAEKTGNFPNDTELGIIKKQYENDFGAKTVIMLQIELTHSIADRWYNGKFSI